ncbi:hypothetical protein FSST1_012792 [Fusarium sambucinum]
MVIVYAITYTDSIKKQIIFTITSQLYLNITMESTKNNAQKVWSAIVKHAKEHHRSVNAAVNVYYPTPSALSPRAATAKTVYSTSSSARSSYEKN